MTWYIDSWAVLDGIAFASEREADELDAERTVLLAVPELKPVPVTHVATALWASRGHFQQGLYDEKGDEIPFQSLAEITELVRRGFVGGGDGGPSPGGPGDVGPLPERPRPNGPEGQREEEPSFEWEDKWGPKPDTPETATEAVRGSLGHLDEKDTPDRFFCTLAALDALTRANRLTRRDELVMAIAGREELRGQINRDLATWFSILYGRRPWRHSRVWAPVRNYLRRRLSEDEWSEFAWWFDYIEDYPQRSYRHGLMAELTDGLLFRSPISVGPKRPKSLGDLLAMASANPGFLTTLSAREWEWLILVARIVVVASWDGWRQLDDRKVFARAVDWLRSALPREKAVPHRAAKELEKFLQHRLEERVG